LLRIAGLVYLIPKFVCSYRADLAEPCINYQRTCLEPKNSL